MEIRYGVLFDVRDIDINSDGSFDKWDGVTSIGEESFNRATSIRSIAIPKSIKSIGNSAFSNCIKLKSIIIPEGVTSIGHDAFCNCTNLTSIIIPDSVTSIGYSAFYNCTNLTSIIILDSVKSIGYSAFYNCKKLLYIKNNCLDNYNIFNDVTYKSLRIISNWFYPNYNNYIPINDIPFII